MFATPSSYSVTPCKSNFARIPERASSIIRDVKRRSLRTCRTKAVSEKRLSGTFHPITEDDSRLTQPDTSHSLTWQEGSETPRSVSSSNSKNHNNSDLTNYNSRRKQQISVTPMIVRKFSFQSHCETPTVLSYNPDPGVTLSDTECGDNKENEAETKSERTDKLEKFSCRVKTRSSSIRRRCSSYFTPLSKRSVGKTGRMSGSVRALDRSDLTEKKLSEIASGGRLIPLKQGYMYKKSVSGIYKRKYVTLCSDSVLTYYPSFQAYIDNVDGKEIQLSHVTVKIPGKKPSGLKTCSEGSTVSEESGCDKEDLTLELCQPELDQDQPSVEKERNKRKRLSTQSESSVTDLQLVSLDGSIWQFQMCTLEEVEDWEKAIQGEILNSLCSREVLNLDHIRHDIPGNTVCADCSTPNPDWASINLGILICIECSGIHRNLGSHISKVRSLSLDCWSQMNIKTLENIGNSKANQFWERNIQAGVKPLAKSSRETKVNFIKSKYCLKSFCTFDYVDLGEENSIGALI